MRNGNLRALCNRCDVPLAVDHARVHCPICGSDFGFEKDVRVAMEDKVHQAFRDRDGWRADDGSSVLDPLATFERPAPGRVVRLAPQDRVRLRYTEPASAK